MDEVRKRGPDLAYFTVEHINEMGLGIRQKTRFVIEILSDSESYEPERWPEFLENITERGPQDYFDADVQLAWYIISRKKRMYVHASPNESKAFKGTDVISATPVTEGFEFVVEELFKQNPI